MLSRILPPLSWLRPAGLLSLRGWIVLVGLLLPINVRAAEEGEIPAPRELILACKKDGLALHATYFAGTHDKDTVPILLIHSYKHNGTELDDLALYLQSLGPRSSFPTCAGTARARPS